MRILWVTDNKKSLQDGVYLHNWLPPSVPLRPQPRACTGLSCPCWSSWSSSTWWQALLCRSAWSSSIRNRGDNPFRSARDELPQSVGANHRGNQFLDSVLLQAAQQGQRWSPSLPRLTYLTLMFCDEYIILLVKSISFPDLSKCMGASRQLEVLLVTDAVPAVADLPSTWRASKC